MTTRRKFSPLKLDLASMRRTLALLKRGKLFTPVKKARRPLRPGMLLSRVTGQR